MRQGQCDCDDSDAAALPGGTEACDGVDNDCDGEIDETLLVAWYPDADGDGWGDAAQAGSPTLACPGELDGTADNADDCDDGDAAVNPGDGGTGAPQPRQQSLGGGQDHPRALGPTPGERRDQGSGDQGSGDQGSGDQGSGDQGSGDQGSGDQTGPPGASRAVQRFISAEPLRSSKVQSPEMSSPSICPVTDSVMR